MGVNGVALAVVISAKANPGYTTENLYPTYMQGSTGTGRCAIFSKFIVIMAGEE